MQHAVKRGLVPADLLWAAGGAGAEDAPAETRFDALPVFSSGDDPDVIWPIPLTIRRRNEPKRA